MKCTLEWLRLAVVEYYDPISRKNRSWEFVERTTHSGRPSPGENPPMSTSDTDAVSILAIIPHVLPEPCGIPIPVRVVVHASGSGLKTVLF